MDDDDVWEELLHPVLGAEADYDDLLGSPSSPGHGGSACSRDDDAQSCTSGPGELVPVVPRQSGTRNLWTPGRDGLLKHLFGEYGPKWRAIADEFQKHGYTGISDDAARQRIGRLEESEAATAAEKKSPKVAVARPSGSRPQVRWRAQEEVDLLYCLTYASTEWLSSEVEVRMRQLIEGHGRQGLRNKVTRDGRKKESAIGRYKQSLEEKGGTIQKQWQKLLPLFRD
tara:strand:+ start:6483 stop:7163 length:681 start_codon:yes stop_codon:yes gene_type:complete